MTSRTGYQTIAIQIFTNISKSGPVFKLKNLSDVQSILLGAVENDFQLVIRKESYKNASDL